MEIQVDAPVETGRKINRIDSRSEQLIGTLRRNERLVYDALCQSKTPLKAYELLDELQGNGLRAPMTIYRALEALIAKECVKKIESLNAFIAVGFDRKPRARAFLICRECMQAKEIALDERQIAGLFTPIEVSASDVRIEAFGECHQVCAHPTK
ncbi:MAG: transcriptional repressor [Pseudomonadota bacterium]